MEETYIHYTKKYGRKKVHLRKVAEELSYLRCHVKIKIYFILD